ncbi:MAG: glycosyl hydrolase family 28 protein [Paludibacter sp.]|nr:glycosyl hydrolase family 28 protein [Paludibacter sp.]
MKETNTRKINWIKSVIVSFFTFMSLSAVSATVTLPNIPATQFLITSYGASTSSLDNSSYINSAITAANSAGGGTVVIPAGTFLSGPITMKSNVNLYISAGAILQMMPYGSGNGSPAGSYPNNGTTDSYANLIFGSGLSNIEVSGSGTIEGNGNAWWAAYTANNNISRPYLIRFKACNTVLITGITLQNSPNVHVCLGQSGSSYGSNGTISNITVIAPSTSPNTDAIDTWYWNGINIINCNLSEGDDNVAMDSYSTNINIKKCTFGNGHGVSVGSYATNVKYITVDSCTFDGTTNGIRLKSELGRGGADSSFVYSNITMKNVKYPFYITSWYPKEPYPASAQVAGTVTSTTPSWNNITFQNMTITNSTYGGIIYGLPEMYVNNVIFDNVQLSASSGLVTNFVSGMVFKNCSSITVSSGNAIIPYAATITGINTTSGVSTSCTTSGIAEIKSDSKLTCYPNPLVGDNFTVSSDIGISKIKIYSLTGVEIKEQNGNESTLVLVNFSGIKDGYYIVNVKLNNGLNSSLKLVKE